MTHHEGTKIQEPKRDKNWKRLFLWSSLGSVAVGTTLAILRKPKTSPSPALVCRRIPPDLQSILILTEHFELQEDGGKVVARDKYLLEATPFLVWSILEVASESRARPGGRVYHITHFRETDGEDTQNNQVMDKFYGTVACVGTNRKACPSNYLARGGLLQIRKCHVGGSANGIETGEVHQSVAPILNYRFNV